VPDPFLVNHAVAPFQFDLSGPIAPISIRDQMVRARLLVDRAWDAGLINRSGRPLLVGGAGAAGATAAIRATQRGVLTVLVDAAPAPFLRQAGCRSRLVDPLQYDWPVDHWNAGRYPWMPPSMPLPWRTDIANRLAIHWTRLLNAQRIIHRGTLVVRYGLALPSVAVAHATNMLNVAFPSGSGLPTSFGMLVSGIGFGTERSSVPRRPPATGRYEGLQFWDTDAFASIGKTGTPTSILISGGGDGGLQDFVRIMTRGLSAKGIYRQLYDPAASGIIPEWAELEQAIQSAEDQAWRAFSWGDKPYDHAVHSWLHGIHLAAIAKLLASSAGPNVRATLGSLLPTPGLNIRLVHPCSHFSQCYGLNRFLVLLIARYLQDAGHSNPLQSDTGVQFVDCRHAPPFSPPVCYGQSHDVWFQTVACATSGAASPRATPYDVVIIRHGADPPHRLGRTPVLHPRELLPYHVAS